MGNLALGLIGVVWGAGILVNHFAVSQPAYGDGAYAAGRSAALIFAAILVLAGGRAVVKGLRART